MVIDKRARVEAAPTAESGGTANLASAFARYQFRASIARAGNNRQAALTSGDILGRPRYYCGQTCHIGLKASRFQLTNALFQPTSFH